MNRVTGTAAVLRADARSLPLADDSVDLVVTSPPYFALRSYQDGGEHYAGQIGDEPTPAEFVSSLLHVTRECVRVLKPSGSLWVNLGDKYASSGPSGPQGATGQRATRTQSATDAETSRRQRKIEHGIAAKSLIGIPWRYALACIDDLGLILRAEVIWSKPNGLPESVTDRVRRSHEQWFHFTLEPRYFSAVDEIREGYAPGTAARYAYGFQPAIAVAAGQSQNGPTRADGGGPNETNPLGKLPGSVWTVPTEPLKVPEHLGVDHFAAFPTEWPKRIIQAWSPADGVVLDPFGGTGTTAMVAKALGRQGLSVDRSSDYCRIGQWRTTNRNQLGKVLGLDRAPEPDAGQLDIFGTAL
jgi:DNA modification methylase